MTAQEILEELKPLGSESYRKLLFRNYGVKEPCFGVKIGDLKKIQKRIKKDYQLALDLYATGNYDAMYLAGLIADDARMSEADLQKWVEMAYAAALPGATVPWVAAGSPHGWKVANKWINAAQPLITSAGWATLSSLVALQDDTDLDLPELERLLNRVQETIYQAPDVVRYQMNGFVIAVGSYVKPLSESALRIAEVIGPVMADLGNNSCQVPFAPDYIRKAQEKGSLEKKRKTVKC